MTRALSARHSLESDFDNLIKLEVISVKKYDYKFKYNNKVIQKNIEFYSYDDIVWFNYKKNKVIDLVSYVDNFSTPIFVLNLKNNKVYGMDNEHDNLTLLADWDEFYKKMEYYVDGYISGKFDR